ncbi:carbohydrate esterase family 16 protein [Backusella circina FSU 941]|nr:carbohydrate esterase family 16 protein [Backusella circina FSU 941]
MRFKLFAIAIFYIPSFSVAATVKNLVIFGDSNSDVGNTQRWSNGPLWSEYLAFAWDTRLYSFAYSGAVCDSHVYGSTSNEKPPPSIKDQVEAFYKLKLDLNPEETVFGFWLGFNDIVEATKLEDTAAVDIKNIVNCISQQVKSIRKIFSSNRVLLLNVPPLEYMPYFADSELALNYSMATTSLNKLLSKEVANLNKHHHGLEMDFVDIHTLIADLFVNPTVFGYKNSISPYLDDCSEEFCSGMTNKYVWWDKTHFTTAFHRTIANSILEAESYMPRASVGNISYAKEVIFASGSPYKSKKYIVEPSEGLVEAAIKEIDSKTAANAVTAASSNEKSDLNNMESLKPSYFSKNHFGLLCFIAILLGMILWIRSPRAAGIQKITLLFQNRDRGKFLPIRSEQS